MPARTEREDLAGARVLVVKDEFLIALEVEFLLRDFGCEVLGPVPSVVRALELLGRERPDAALLDLDLLDGMAVLAITHIFDQPQGGYSYSFDLRLDPMRLDHVGALKRLSTEELDVEDSQQTVDLTRKDVGNCKMAVPVAELLASMRVPFALVTANDPRRIEAPALREVPHLAKPVGRGEAPERMLAALLDVPRAAHGGA